MDYKGEILKKEARNADVKCHNACNEKVKTLIEYSLTPFEDGLKETINWYQKNI